MTVPLLPLTNLVPEYLIMPTATKITTTITTTTTTMKTEVVEEEESGTAITSMDRPKKAKVTKIAMGSACSQCKLSKVSWW